MCEYMCYAVLTVIVQKLREQVPSTDDRDYWQFWREYYSENNVYPALIFVSIYRTSFDAFMDSLVSSAIHSSRIVSK